MRQTYLLATITDLNHLKFQTHHPEKLTLVARLQKMNINCFRSHQMTCNKVTLRNIETDSWPNKTARLSQHSGRQLTTNQTVSS